MALNSPHLVRLHEGNHSYHGTMLIIIVTIYKYDSPHLHGVHGMNLLTYIGHTVTLLTYMGHMVTLLTYMGHMVWLSSPAWGIWYDSPHIHGVHGMLWLFSPTWGTRYVHPHLHGVHGMTILTFMGYMVWPSSPTWGTWHDSPYLHGVHGRCHPLHAAHHGRVHSRCWVKLCADCKLLLLPHPTKHGLTHRPHSHALHPVECCNIHNAVVHCQSSHSNLLFLGLPSSWKLNASAWTTQPYITVNQSVSLINPILISDTKSYAMNINKALTSLDITHQPSSLCSHVWNQTEQFNTNNTTFSPYITYHSE